MGAQLAIFMDIEFVAVDEADYPDAFVVVFDAIYAGETWCRSLVWVDADMAALLDRDERAVISAARNTLLERLAVEPGPVSFELRLSQVGSTVIARGTPGARQ
jgi:hypothetical protein